MIPQEQFVVIEILVLLTDSTLVVISVYHSLQGNVFELEHPLICNLVSDSLHTYVYTLVCTG